MLKPTSTYKMNKQTKRSLALIVDPQARGVQKRMMIQAELIGAVRIKERKKPEAGTGNE